MRAKQKEKRGRILFVDLGGGNSTLPIASQICHGALSDHLPELSDLSIVGMTSIRRFQHMQSAGNPIPEAYEKVVFCYDPKKERQVALVCTLCDPMIEFGLEVGVNIFVLEMDGILATLHADISDICTN